MSRLYAWFATVVVMVSLVACGGDDSNVPPMEDASLDGGADAADATVEDGASPLADGSAPLDAGTLDAADATADATLDSGADAGSDAETDAGASGSYPLSFTVSGLAGTGLFLADNGADIYAVTGNGTFTFDTPIASGGRYSVGVLQQPSSPSQTCAFTDAAGNVIAAPSGTIGGAADVPSILVRCSTNTFTVGGTITGLASGATLTLENEGVDSTPITGTAAASLPFAMATPVPAGAAFYVSISGQPSAQTCAVSGGSGTVVSGNVSSVSINCSTNTVTIGGTVTGLAGGAMVLQDNGGDDLTIAANGSFAFSKPIPVGSDYLVTVLTPPSAPAQQCTVANGGRLPALANVTNVSVSCSTLSYSVSATINGIAAGESAVLADNGGDDLTVTSADNGKLVTFPAKVPSGELYIVSVVTNPAAPIAQTCTVGGGDGIIGSANVSGVTVNCATNLYTVGGNIKLDNGGSFVLQDEGGDDLPVSSTGTFTFGMPLASGSPYSVGVSSAPAGQSCTITNARGTVTSGNIVTVSIECALVGQQVFTSSGTFTVPDGLTSISAVAIGPGGNALPIQFGGGGGGGALCYANAITVASGQSIAVTIGGPGSVSATSILSINAGAGTNAAMGNGGAGGTGNGGICNNGGAGGGTDEEFGDFGGGGGAAGYQGVGGAGASGGATCGAAAASGSGGGGGGGGASTSACPFDESGGGGGVGLMGELVNGAGGDVSCGCGVPAGSGGSGSALTGGAWGGGGGGTAAPGGGAVRIIWGPNRAYPSTNTADM